MTRWRLFALAGAAATALYALNAAPAVNLTCAMAIGAGAVWACFAGPRATWPPAAVAALLFVGDIAAAVAGPPLLDVPFLVAATLLGTAALHPGRVRPEDPPAPEPAGLEAALRRALGDGGLHVAYQPIVDLRTGVPIGAEALARWVHPEHGPVPPATFIPIAEDAGLIAEIGARVRREALGQVGRWRADGVVTGDFSLAVNVSPHQLTDPGLPAAVAAELLAAGLPARCLALEITGPAPVAAAGRVLFELRALGLGLLVDDFGSGLSALGDLRRLPVTGVKLDPTLVTGLGLGPADDEIVRAVVAMCHALHLTVTAEGVETRRQRDALAAAGVRHAQGWLWGPAVPAAEFAAHWHASGTSALVTRRP